MTRWLIGAGCVMAFVPLGLRWAQPPSSTPFVRSAVAADVGAPSESDEREQTARAWPSFQPSFVDSMRAGHAAYDQGDYSAAVARYTQALGSQPDSPDAQNDLAQALARTGQPDQAIPLLARAIDGDSHRWAFRFNRAHAYGQMGDWLRAIEDYRQAASLFPEDYATQYNLGLALERTGDEAAAVAAFSRAADLAPGEPSFVLSLANGYEHLGRRDDAREAYRRFLDSFPEAAQSPQVRSRLAELTTPPPPSDLGR